MAPETVPRLETAGIAGIAGIAGVTGVTGVAGIGGGVGTFAVGDGIGADEADGCWTGRLGALPAGSSDRRAQSSQERNLAGFLLQIRFFLGGSARFSAGTAL